jgi:hypothetical protein
MKQINITRDSKGNVTFEEVSIDVTENVFFTNLDTQAAHWPYLAFCDNQIGPAPSPNSSQCTVVQQPPIFQFLYGCKLHDNERGIINVYPQLAAVNQSTKAVVNKPLKVQVVSGGKSPYTITGQLFQVTDDGGKVIDSGSGVGPGLQLIPDQQKNGGITIAGTPTVVGNYQFTFTVNDGMGGNLQQTQYSIQVTSS